MSTSGLRERKKWETRRRISDVASAMIRERGFDNVTVAQIAEAAQVSRMTVFNYFPRKEDLYLDRSAEISMEFRSTITERPAGVSVVDAVRGLHERWLADGHPLSGVVEHLEHFWRVIEQTPALQARLLEQQQEFRDELAAVLRSTGVNEWDAWVAAGFIAVAHETIFTTAMRRMLAGEPAKRVRKDQAGVITRAFDAVAAALASLGL